MPSNTPDRYSLEEIVRERAELERAWLALRRGAPAEVADARRILREIIERVNFTRPDSYLDGEPRANLLADVAVALSRIGQEEMAVKLSERLLDLASSGSRRTIQLNNIGVRQMRLGFIQSCGGDLDAASLTLEAAVRNLEEALGMRLQEPDASARSTRLLAQANLTHAELELAILDQDLESRTAALEAVRCKASQVVRDSYEIATVTPISRLLRTKVLGQVILEQALVAEVQGKAAEASSLAVTARVGMQANMEHFIDDADEGVADALRFGEACRLSGDVPAARQVWERARSRAVTLRGDSSPIVHALGERLELLP